MLDNAAESDQPARFSQIQAQSELFDEPSHANAQTSKDLLPVLPRFIHGDSLSVLTQWLNLAFARLGVKQQHTIKRSASLLRGRYSTAPFEGDLVSVGSIDNGFEAFRSSVLQVLPFMGAHDAPSTINSAGSPAPNVSAVLHDLIHATTGPVDTAQGSKAATSFDYAFAQIHRIIANVSSIASIQTLYLMTLMCRWRQEVDVAWHLLSLATAMAQTQGLYRRGKPCGHGTGDMSANKHWCPQHLSLALYVLDKALAVELERQPFLREPPLDDSISSCCETDLTVHFRALIKLSRLQNQALDLFERSRKSEEDAKSTMELDTAVKGKMQVIGELDQSLQTWLDDLPPALRPSEVLYSDGSDLMASTFLTVQYYQTILLIHRNALILSSDTIRTQVDTYFVDQPYRLRLRNGQNVCIQAARGLITVLIHAEENGAHSILFTSHAPLLAIYALAIYIIRRVSPATATSDLELMSTGISLIRGHIEVQRRQTNADSEDSIMHLLEHIHDVSASYVARKRDHTTAPKTSYARGTPNDVAEANSVQDPSTAMLFTPDDGSEYNSNVINDNIMSELLGDSVQGMNVDWDALALTFDLPSA